VESWDLRRLSGPVAAKADPMLMVRYSGNPWARYADNVWSWPPGTYKDNEVGPQDATTIATPRCVVDLNTLPPRVLT